MGTFRTRIGATGAALLATAVLAGSAHAATTGPVTAAVKREDAALKSSSALTSLKGSEIRTKAEIRRAIPKFVTLQRRFDHAADVVSRVHATTSAQREGQRDWVAGARLVARTFGDYATGLRDVLRGDKAAAKRELARALKLDVAAAKLGKRADTLLGVPKSA